ncbi:MAG: V-type ATP synthase subunit D [Deltaproteobacteria bacterium]|nr:V-type ATP synthase subunit D [Deltaproteobacteria bacterium]MBW1939888.1 V-type ATP synthase subunit D [Deltaproteobacteria bacterium]MBW2010626.1 V-type ATP synthase subunit D [Deltaproteobacteria bacterium]MBW2099360.1 V-type ATP synthase subunit D [Deltaproteobacteria bacterium]
MKKVKLTKNELRKQKDDLKRYNRYLPTLYIKKQQLQKEVERIRGELAHVKQSQNRLLEEVLPWVSLFSEDVDIAGLIQLHGVKMMEENIAGVDIPVLDQVDLENKRYDLFIYPLWVDRAMEILSKMIHLKIQRTVLEEQKRRLSQELRIASQRVNLFEKVKIPETLNAIRKISIHLADLQTAAVGWARIAKKKIAR